MTLSLTEALAAGTLVVAVVMLFMMFRLRNRVVAEMNRNKMFRVTVGQWMLTTESGRLAADNLKVEKPSE